MPDVRYRVGSSYGAPRWQAPQYRERRLADTDFYHAFKTLDDAKVFVDEISKYRNPDQQKVYLKSFRRHSSLAPSTGLTPSTIERWSVHRAFSPEDEYIFLEVRLSGWVATTQRSFRLGSSQDKHWTTCIAATQMKIVREIPRTEIYGSYELASAKKMIAKKAVKEPVAYNTAGG